MRHLRAWFVRFGGFFRRDHSERALAAEMESHLQMHIEDNLGRGMSALKARREALMKLGGIELIWVALLGSVGVGREEGDR